MIIGAVKLSLESESNFGNEVLAFRPLAPVDTASVLLPPYLAVCHCLVDVLPLHFNQNLMIDRSVVVRQSSCLQFHVAFAFLPVQYVGATLQL